jgi:hypothetical protein
MRKTYHAQLPLTSMSSHPRAAELCVLSAVLDANSEAPPTGTRRPASTEKGRCKAGT